MKTPGKGNNNVTQEQSNFIPFAFPKFSNYESHLFYNILVEKNDNKK